MNGYSPVGAPLSLLDTAVVGCCISAPFTLAINQELTRDALCVSINAERHSPALLCTTLPGHKNAMTVNCHFIQQFMQFQCYRAQWKSFNLAVRFGTYSRAKFASGSRKSQSDD